ncbi:sister chromatid cohesion protein PDS5 homolog B-B-like isoform X1 [Daphnia carinata]|uniref:sister chromatid cohesion protein PDS5 homolog B-B-like isoform X1 n=1 Tax=Daphnia carinata TaxID=120202 RepID=UPI002580042E|nr:sister chromatid cohesion protein PDS5 homolog B-B-like isoform X1 [Daphnia carinata]
MPGGGDTVTIIYPQGCKEVTEDLTPDELIRRLKTLAHTFQSMGQEEGAYQEFVPLALHLADDFFLQHHSRDVQLLIACCIADVLRVYAPDAPYTDPEQVKGIFLFLIRQLGGLKDPKDPAFKRYFYLLENLAYVKSFNMCFDLEDCQEIFCELFKLIFKIVNDEHSGKVKSFMLDILCPLITESDSVSNELLDIILSNIVEPLKSQRKNAYKLARELLLKCSDTLEPYIQAFFNQVLILGKEDKQLFIATKVYDLIYELYHVCSRVLLSVLPQLEFKLKSPDEQERMGCVSLLARMFSEKDSQLATQHRQLWRAFLGRFNDISVAIRTKCVQYSMHFLLNHPELRQDVTETLKLRQHDAEESVRYEVVTAIVATAKRDFSIVSDSEDLVNFVKERTLDKKFKIRKEALTGLAMIYKTFLGDPDVPETTKKAVTWIKDKILHGYYMTGLEDRLLVERLLNTCLVPYQLPADVRMKKLYYLYATIDENATKSFIELQKSQATVRKAVSDLTEVYNQLEPGENRDKEITTRVAQLSKYLPDPIKAAEFIHKFAVNLASDSSMLQLLETVVNPEVSCKECAEAGTQLLKKLGQPVMTNLYYNTVKLLMERISSVLIDKDAVTHLVQYVEACLRRDEGTMAEEIGIEPETAGEKGLRLLFVLAFGFPAHFMSEDVLTRLVNILSLDSQDHSVSAMVLCILTFVGKYRPLEAQFRDIVSQLIPICERLATEGTTKQAKHAMRCLHVNITNHEQVFSKILESLKDNLTTSSPHCRTSIVTLGHMALLLPDRFTIQIKNIVSRKIVKELLLKNHGETQPISSDISNDEWCEEDQLPEETRCKVEAMKMMARWLIGLKNDVMSAQKTFRMLTAFIQHRGDLFDGGRIGKTEMAWLRLSAGTAMLKICEQKGVGDQFTVDQFYSLSLLIADDMPEVRERFTAKLHRGLYRMPLRSLPLDFMGVYALAGTEEDKRIKAIIRRSMLADISKRRDYQRELQMSGSMERMADKLPYILPDYMLVYAVPILAHDPEFTSHTNTEQLLRIRQCLWFVLEPLMNKHENYCFGFYKALIERMKNHRDALKPEDEESNAKLWAVCDLAMGLIMQKTTSFEMKDYPTQPRIPSMYFRTHDDPNFLNTKIYLPPELQIAPPKKASTVGGGGVGSGLVKVSALKSFSGASIRGKGGRRGRPPKQDLDDVESDEEPEESFDQTVMQSASNTDESMATRRSSRIRTSAPHTSIGANSGSEDSQEATTPISKEKPKTTGAKITSYFSPKQRAAAAASATVDSDNSNMSQNNGTEDQSEPTEQPLESLPKRRGRPPRNPAMNEKEVESSSAAEEETEAEVKSRKRSKEEEKDTTVVTPARKSARLAKPN